MRPIDPGEILREKLSARAFARALDIPVDRVTQILREQSDYELRRVRREVGNAIEHTVSPRAA
jgi:hypothetical protein